MYIGKEVTRLVSFSEVERDYYIHLEFIGTFKIGKFIRQMIGGKERIIVITENSCIKIKDMPQF